MAEKNVQKRILEVMYLDGNPMKIKDLIKSSNMKETVIQVGIRHLVNRGLVKKEIVLSKARRRNPPHKKGIYSLRQSLMPKILKIINELREEEKNDAITS